MEEPFVSEESISASPDFAQVYIFIQTFGSLLKLPPVTLSGLEDFFLQGYTDKDSQLVRIHWRLLNGITYIVARAEWQRSAVKYARRHGLCAEGIPYHELSAQLKLKIFRLCCEEQFEFNLSFKNEIKRDLIEGPLSRPLIGYDSSGQKHWLLKDSVFDIRLYGESHYDVLPPKKAKWVELVRSLDGLAKYIAGLEASRGGSQTSPKTGSHDNHVTSSRQKKREGKSAESHRGNSKSKGKVHSPVWDGHESIEGCIKCRRDINHSQMLLCDECDRECHTYCQYPRLWKVPRGKWSCPICKEGHLIEELKKVYTELSTAKALHEKSLEKKQKSMEKLQRTGLLLQNIILEDGQEEVGRRSRRSRKEINYAELNDIQLPPLGRRDYVGNSDWSPPPVTKRRRIREEYIHEDYLVPRIRSSTRRFRRSPILEPETSKTETLEPVSGDEDSDNLTISPRVSTSGECLSTEALKKSSPPSPHQSDREHSDNSSTPNAVSSIKDFEKIGNAIDDAHPKLNFEPNGFTQNLQTLMTSQPDHAESDLFEGQGHTTITTKAVDTTSIYNVQCNDRHR